MADRVDSIRVVHPLFQAEEGGSTPTSTLQLYFHAVDIKTAAVLNRAWHSRLPKFARPTCRIAYAAEFDNRYFAVAIWTNPLARMLPQQTWIELNRMAVAPDAPKNTASRMLAWMARDMRKRFPVAANLISYQDIETRAGTIYRAAGWTPTHRSDGGEWDSASKARNPVVAGGAKQRWEKSL